MFQKIIIIKWLNGKYRPPTNFESIRKVILTSLETIKIYNLETSLWCIPEKFEKRLIHEDTYLNGIELTHDTTMKLGLR